MFRFSFTTGTGTGHVNPVLPVVRTPHVFLEACPAEFAAMDGVLPASG